MPPLTIAHVTHEAVDHLGGIGTVLHGLLTSPVYRRRIGRSILIGPSLDESRTDGAGPLGAEGRVLYSAADGIDDGQMRQRLGPVESKFGVRIVYGHRRVVSTDGHREAEAEVLLVDVRQVDPKRLAIFKLQMWETFGIDSSRYEQAWDYEEYVRLAAPACEALLALLGDARDPCVVFGHEFMGMPTVLAALHSGDPRLRTVFHAHECATVRRIVEDHPGHDIMFYNVLDQAKRLDLHVEDVFGPQDGQLRHALIRRAHLCDAVLAVGDHVRDELHFINPEQRPGTVDLVYNGVPSAPCDADARERSRQLLLDYAVNLGLPRPHLLMTHVTRPVISKGLWRDLKVCHELDRALVADRRTAVLFILTTGGGTRSEQDVQTMANDYGWPRHHQPGYPDLTGPEIYLCRDVDTFNKGHEAIQVVLVNQFGWSRSRLGPSLPAEMTMADLRRATDVEFGMAVYEPFGISPLEPLAAGAICVISQVCGCSGLVRRAADGDSPNVLCADFTHLESQQSIERLKEMTQEQRDRLEQAAAVTIADELLSRLPQDEAQRRALTESGQKLAARMGWDQIAQTDLLPVIDRITTEQRVQSLAV
jgi:glycosyltransferase involved in cell wall biosynthesis